MTTEQMARKCFCPNSQIQQQDFVLDDHIAGRIYKTIHCRKDVLYLARAARAFCRMEQRKKWDKDRARIHKKFKGAT